MHLGMKHAIETIKQLKIYFHLEKGHSSSSKQNFVPYNLCIILNGPYNPFFMQNLRT